MEKIKRQVKTYGLRFLYHSGAAGLIGRIYGGRGVILMFHEFTHCPHSMLDQGCRIDDFEAVLAAVRADGRDIVGFGEALQRLADPDSPPFVVLTFDDGYRSNLELALPVMERYEAPAIIFVPTGMVTRTVNAWWLGLRDMIVSNEAIDVEPLGMRLDCADLDAKIAALRRLTAWVWDDFRRVDLLDDAFAAHGVRMPDLVERLAMSEREMIQADRHPLIEIGAHTTTHRALGLLSADEVATDIGDNKRFLEERLQREVPYFAYPYGPPSITGRREADIVKALGFRAAMTTEPGCLFPEHGEDPYLIPRQDAEYTEDGLAQAMCGLHGVFRALASRGGTPAVRLGVAA
ncbi:polysaccharide deacetylase family protein [Polymorphum gilvum]|uniref:Chitooligosaccharide deacetylase n=1 Tax=Polymorphum gilvum (strain LMG 25793 / CGMCC 1.9160 / SL003B-26A1) TaxID=991905 RepID=F2J5G3_POLGS|nr:polysaccharide deacetylase family protein [Polymorphum gilvum]ADZ72332.1 Polysaccharide deacetylase [Polymorphum gilvum SL003B-26A1]